MRGDRDAGHNPISPLCQPARTGQRTGKCRLPRQPGASRRRFRGSHPRAILRRIASVQHPGHAMKRAAILAALLALGADAASAAPGDALVIVEDGAALLDRPQEDAAVLLRMSRGHRLVEVERRDSWVRVTVAGVLLPGREIWIPAAAVGTPPPEPPSDSGVEILEDESVAAFGGIAGTIILEVTGTAARFTSDCRLTSRDGGVRHRVMRGEVPAAIELRTDFASCLVGKESGPGRLRANLLSAGAVVAFAETMAPFGRVRVATSGSGANAGSFDRRGDRIVVFPVPFPHPHPSRHRGLPPASGNPVPPFTQSPVPSFQ